MTHQGRISHRMSKKKKDKKKTEQHTIFGFEFLYPTSLSIHLSMEMNIRVNEVATRLGVGEKKKTNFIE